MKCDTDNEISIFETNYLILKKIIKRRKSAKHKALIFFAFFCLFYLIVIILYWMFSVGYSIIKVIQSELIAM